jgi:hypothetical protein
MQKRMRTFLFFSLLASALTAGAQSDTALFSFWTGEWNASWKEVNGKDTVNATGENTISRTLGGKVLHEQFNVLSGQSKGFQGESWSVCSKQAGTWKQTWVDNQGAYMDFTEGRGPHNEPAFERTVRVNGKKTLQRMVFRDIRPTSFTWDWEVSTDEGKTWKLNWRIFYTRKK